MLSVETASGLLDMGRRVGEKTGRDQLEAAVAVYNLLDRQRVAYLADEVGMGKTYVALAALALLRHFKPRTRVLILAPRENIQKKWIKELRTFTQVCVKYDDLRVRSLQGTPARALVSCENLVELVREISIDPDRDFFARLTSFSFGLGRDASSWKETRNRFLQYLPAEDPSDFDLRDKAAFKDAVGRALARALPRFDLVIVDEAHNLKAGFSPDRRSQAARNRILGLAFGGREEGGRPSRVQRLLLLSATPVEDDYRQLWNQLDIFGRAGGVPELRDDKLDEERRKATARRLLIRRVTELECAGGMLTKTEYRREWRRGGTDLHDLPVEIDDSQKLTAALVQKKVGEILNSARFNASFQIGMLASFESFLETRRLRRAGSEDELGSFDDAEQTDDAAERAGVDVDAVDRLASDYRKRFGDRELPHPKMDGLVQHLRTSFRTGQKALVFVRRVASVRELRRKLEQHYDDYLLDRLRRELVPELQAELERQFRDYGEARRTKLQRREVTREALTDHAEIPAAEPPDSEGGTETFFAWFFRGEGPPGVFSGANFQRRFLQKRAAVATFFEDNHVAFLLGVAPGSVRTALEAALGMRGTELTTRLRAIAEHYNTDAKPTRRGQFLAWQAAALEMLALAPDPDLAARSAHVWAERYQPLRTNRRRAVPDEADWLEEPTFFTGLCQWPELRRILWPESVERRFEASFHERELRRELLSTMARLGHAFIDLYVLAANQQRSLRAGARPHDDSGRELIQQYLHLLERQAEQGTSFVAYHELAEAAASYDAIVDANAPEIRLAPLNAVGRDLGVLLSTQQPVGGMSGAVNLRMVRQFRMPGYPLVLITTDVLQEGEDLHLFCSRVYHYGLSWTPSAMEQRVGRIDRVRSQTHRRLQAVNGSPASEEKLQVYYPHLRETAEAYQVQIVLERLNRFIVLMHEDLRSPELDQRHLNLRQEVARGLRDVPAITARLKTAFPVPTEYLGDDVTVMGVGPEFALGISRRFEQAAELIGRALGVTWVETRIGVRVGTLRVGDRSQGFTLQLRSTDGLPVVRCISPIGTREDRLDPADLEQVLTEPGVRMSVAYHSAAAAYQFAVEGDVLLWEGADDGARLTALVRTVTRAADDAEARLLESDPEPAASSDLTEGAGDER